MKTKDESVSIWCELHDDFEDEGFLYIDAFTTEDEDENGMTIAKINLTTCEVEYLDERAKTDAFVQDTIKLHTDNIYHHVMNKMIK